MLVENTMEETIKAFLNGNKKNNGSREDGGRQYAVRTPHNPASGGRGVFYKRGAGIGRGMGILSWNFTGLARRICKRLRNVPALYAWFSRKDLEE